MFSRLADFAFKRTALQAFGFYIAWLLLAVLVSGLLAFVAALMVVNGLGESGTATDEGYQLGLRIGNILAVIFSIGLSIAVVRGKNMLKQFPMILLIVLSGLLAAFGGGLLGLIIPAYLTTRASSA